MTKKVISFSVYRSNKDLPEHIPQRQRHVVLIEGRFAFTFYGATIQCAAKGADGKEVAAVIHAQADIDTQIKCFEISLLGLAEMDIDVLVFGFHLSKKREVESRTGHKRPTAHHL